MAQEGSIVIVHSNNKPQFFARIEEIKPDVKAGWYKVRFKPLFLHPETGKPAEDMEWVLRDVYIDGEEFTMNGTPIQLVEIPAIHPPNFQQEDQVEEVTDEDKEDPVKYLNKLIKQPVVALDEYKEVRDQVFGDNENTSA